MFLGHQPSCAAVSSLHLDSSEQRLPSDKMDFVTALSLGSSVITFVQAGATVLKTAKQIHDSADGLSEDTRTRHALVNSMVKAVEKLKENEHEAISSDSSISNLVVECDNVSKKIQACLQKIEQSRWAKVGEKCGQGSQDVVEKGRARRTGEETGSLWRPTSTLV